MGAQPEGDYGSQDIEFHDLGIPGSHICFWRRLQEGSRKKVWSGVLGPGRRRKAEGAWGRLSASMLACVSMLEIAALVVALHGRA